MKQPSSLLQCPKVENPTKRQNSTSKPNPFKVPPNSTFFIYFDYRGHWVAFHILRHQPGLDNIEGTWHESCDDCGYRPAYCWIDDLVFADNFFLSDDLKEGELDGREDDIADESGHVADVEPFEPLVFEDLHRATGHVLVSADHELLFYHLKWVPHDIARNLCAHRRKNILVLVVGEEGSYRLVSVKESEAVGEGDDHLTWEPLESGFGNLGEVLLWWWGHDAGLDGFEGVEY